MVYQYVVTLKNNSQKYVDTFSLLLLMISVAVFIRQAFTPENTWPFFFPIVAGIVVLIVALNFYRRQKKTRRVSYSSALFVAAIGWAAIPSFLHWLVIPFVLLGLIERTAKLPLEVGFSDDRVVINTLIRRRYKWADFNNIVLKDDLLTLDLKDNRVIQRETIDEEGDADEDEFNNYCEKQLRAVS